MQNLNKNWLVVWKMTRGIWQIFIKTFERVNIYRGVMCNNTENCEKSEEELTCLFKIDISDLTNFNSSTGKSQKFTL